MRAFRMTVSSWMVVLVAGLLVTAAQPAMAGWTQWKENFNALTPSTGNANHTIAQAGDYIGVDSDVPYGPGTGLVNGWRSAYTGNHFHVVNNYPRAGLASYGLGNNYDGCAGPGCGAAHPTTVDEDTDTVIASVLVREGLAPYHSSGPASFYLGDSSLLAAVGGPLNAYRVDIDMDCDNYGNYPEDNNGDLVTLIDGVAVSIPYSAPDVTDWYMLRITVTNVGTGLESAILEIADVNDSTGEPNTAFTVVGTFSPSVGSFTLSHIMAWTLNDIGCYFSGQAAKLWDNFQVDALDDPATLEIETVPVENTGNLDDTVGDGYGAVDYPYNIGKYEITAFEYCRFLNAVAATDTYELWGPGMLNPGNISQPWLTGCMITQNGTPGNYTYDFSGRPSGTEADWASRPVNYVMLWDVFRFVNWLHNGQPTGAQDASTTEDGAYFMNGIYGNEIDGREIVRKGGAAWFLPTEDEWYKAAWHKNDGDTGNYWDYATGSDTKPGRDVNETTNPGNNANFDDSGMLLGMPYMRTPVGEFEISDSPYGTFDQSGNIAEWNETITGLPSGAAYWGIRGGSYRNVAADMTPSWRGDYWTGNNEGGWLGFRVATEYIPPPGIPGTAVIIR